MYYELYIDSLFCTDLIMNFYVLSLTNRFCGRSATRPRRLLGAAYGAGIYCTMFFLPEGWLFLKLSAGILISALGMVWIVFGCRRIVYLLRLLAAMAGAAFFQGGIFLFVKNQFPLIWGNDLAILSALVIGGAAYISGCFLIEKNKKKEQVFCRVILHIKQWFIFRQKL